MVSKGGLGARTQASPSLFWSELARNLAQLLSCMGLLNTQTCLSQKSSLSRRKINIPHD